MSKVAFSKSMRFVVRPALAAGLTIAAMACAAEHGTDGVESGDVALEKGAAPFAANDKSEGESQKACVNRADWSETITVGTGSWGSWGCMDFCPADAFVYSASIRSESQQNGGDDTAMNAIALGCYDRFSGTYWGDVTSSQAGYGSWRATGNVNPYVVSNPAIGGQMRIEAPQGSGDDTAANAISIQALNGAWFTPATATSWGTWGATSVCGAGRAVCGVSTRIQGGQGSGDDTSLNGVQFACCNF